ncbi:MAG: SDR family NAD(P)-dependent oxidoreductase, partial [Vicinamibacterales bacterium]|nr:SDR family NAD(P)-dependent oxidoreductase [Vicinamibacterales bacterium]
MFDLTGKTALVTGAATGLGQAIAVALTTAGARVALSNRRDLALDETAELCAAQGAAPLSLTIDVRDLAQITEGVAAVEAELGHVDILVNNAAYIGEAVFETFWEMSVDDWRNMMALNVNAIFALT